MDALTETLQRLSAPASRPVPGFADTGLRQLRVAGSRAFALWQALRDRVGDTGYWPVIGPGDAPKRLEEMLPVGEKEPSLTTYRDHALQRAAALPFEHWLLQQRDPVFRADEALARAELFEKHGVRQVAQSFREFAAQWRNSPPWTFDPTKYEWPTGSVRVCPRGALEVLTTWTRDMKPVLIETATLLLLPTRNGWEAPAYLLFGAFNGCPAASVHVALLQWVHERYQAELVALGHGTIEIMPGRKPATHEVALQLAKDFMTYAEAVQGIGTDDRLGEVALSLLQSDTWSFWWD